MTSSILKFCGINEWFKNIEGRQVKNVNFSFPTHSPHKEGKKKFPALTAYINGR